MGTLQHARPRHRGRAGRPRGSRSRLEAAAATLLAEGVTDADGRVGVARRRRSAPGDYRCASTPAPGSPARGVGFYPEVVVAFTVADDAAPPRAACCSAPTATRPTVAAEPPVTSPIRARRAVVDGAEPPAAVGITGERVTVGHGVRRPAGRRPHASPSPTTRCCCPGWSTPTSTSTSRAAPSGRASPPRPAPPPPGASPRSSTCRSTRIPPTTTVAALRDQAGRWPRDQVVRRRRLLGRRGARQPRATSRRCTTPACSASSASCSTPGVEEFRHLEPDQLAMAMAETARLGALMIVHAEDGHLIDEAALDGAALRRLPGLPAGRGGGGRPSARASTSPSGPAAGPTSCTSAPPGAVPTLRAARAEGGLDVSVETCPHYLHLRRRATIADGATELKCCPPIREAANREALWAGARRRRHRPRRHRPLAVHRRPQAAWRRRLRRTPGAASPRCSWACRPSGPAPASAAYPSPTWCAGWPPPPPTGSGWPPRAGSRSAPTPTWSVFAPDEEFVVDVARLHHQQPGLGVRRPPLAGVVRETWLRGRTGRRRGPPRGRLLRRGRAMTLLRAQGRAAAADRARPPTGRGSPRRTPCIPARHA